MMEVFCISIVLVTSYKYLLELVKLISGRIYFTGCELHMYTLDFKKKKKKINQMNPTVFILCSKPFPGTNSYPS